MIRVLGQFMPQEPGTKKTANMKLKLSARCATQAAYYSFEASVSTEAQL
jgi:hypothetical protein